MATKGEAPRQIICRKTRVKESVMMTAQYNTTAFKPPKEFNKANCTSESHSQANHNCPGREKEKKSLWMNCLWFSMYSPARICQPVSPSASKLSQPAGPNANSHAMVAMKKKSKNVGFHKGHRSGMVTLRIIGVAEDSSLRKGVVSAIPSVL